MTRSESAPSGSQHSDDSAAEKSSIDHASTNCTVEVRPSPPVVGAIRPPGSKSLTNRALICAAFSVGESPAVLHGALRSEDTEVMVAALRQVGWDIDVSGDGTEITVGGRLGDSNASAKGDGPAELFIANSGTTIRFLTAALSAAGGDYRLSGVPRMHQRPIGDLTDAIASVIDGRIVTESDGGCPPVCMEGRGWNGHQLKVRGSVSSQYLSGLMMAGPIAASGQPTVIEVSGELVSRPYVDMTAKVMADFGAVVHLQDSQAESGDAALKVVIEPVAYRPVDYDIEPDASAASYFWATAAITGGKVTVQGLSPDALQGDVGLVDVLAKMGCAVEKSDGHLTVQGVPPGQRLTGIDVDMNAISDTVQTLAVVALFADGPTRVRGVAHNRFKETDRIGDLACELRKLGATVEEHDDGMTIHPLTETQVCRSEDAPPIRLATYHDHRMAMSLALVGLRIPGIQIENPACTAKTYPNYFADLEGLIGQSHLWRNDSDD
ncbi:3-phosphoshikimate 1-carboxyvinyltransferase [Crateriforma conspicua]|uniref:3-phosphoshikimate 1-carboxyvinyltransferase n=1 Tax=Crateriforma conspicua TaxID=2527996 RepID=UPI00118A5165|nr:3-phosphoshikimate 1-carboxyvinyltransferase [Crateriforma conspicua]QDV64312.1 3-phosphoshikimate 1-carboxyvinyltransferase [Crateriforma conspicua]